MRPSVSVAATFLILFSTVTAQAQLPDELVAVGAGHTFHGDWSAEARLSGASWRPGHPIRYEVDLQLSADHLASLAAAGIKADKLCVLITAERTFDAEGWMRLPSDERMSTLLTPAGLPIEGGVQGAMTTRYGYAFRSPVDQFLTVPVGQLVTGQPSGTVTASFAGRATLPDDLPPGLYRLRLDFGAMVGTRVYNINGYTFASRPFSTEAGTSTYYYTPVIEADGTHVSGLDVDASRIQARMPWLLLASYASNGYRGVVADEDRHRFATSDRSLISDDVVLPMFDNSGSRLSYSLEPSFPVDTIDAVQNIEWNWASGALSVKVYGPDSSVVDLGTQTFVAKSGNGPTTKVSAVTAWKPQKYGRYTVVATGWITDARGRRYEGGGTYGFWIAKRMTLATATFQGQPYPVGATYGRDTQFNPAVPADVTVTAQLFVNSDPSDVRTLTYSGKASPAGLFGAAQGMKAFPLSAPGEYHARVLATYTDVDGHLWVSVMRHAGIVYPDPSPVIAHGKKIVVGSKSLDRGETQFEGHVHETGEQHLSHITFPYLSGDMLLIGSEGQGANKIEPVLTYRMAGDNTAWDTRLNGVGVTNLSFRTSNGYSPHMYPEYITDREYYYGAAPRPGFMGRFIVADSNVRAPYWAVSPNSFGGQIGASPNGDAPGDIYRLLGGVVLRRAGVAPMYAGYLSSGFLLPRGSNNNRVVAPGSEDLLGSTGERARLFLVGLRPGTSFELGSTLRPALQIDPILPASITFTLHYPDGRREVATGTGDRFGSFAGPVAYPLNVPGVYRYQVEALWNGHRGRMPGLPDSGGYFFVYPKTRPAGATGITIDGATQRTFTIGGGATITGRTGARTLYYTLLTPGAVIDQGEIQVTDGRFEFRFDPAAANARAPIYDIVSVTTGKPQIGRVIHLTFFGEERAPDGSSFFDVARVILRGTTLLAARGYIPLSPVALADAAPVVGAEALADARDARSLVRGPNAIAATDVDSIRTWDARLDRLIREGVLAVDTRVEDTLLPGRTHERLQQYVDGIPVLGGDLTRQTDHGVTTSLFGTLHLEIVIETTPTIAGESARDVAAARAGSRAAATAPPRLVIVPQGDGRYALAWQVTARTSTDIRVCLVDAQTGATLSDDSLLKARAVAARDPGEPGETRTPGVSRVRGGYAAIDRRQAATITTFDLRGDPRRTGAVVEGTSALTAADVAFSPTEAWRDTTVAAAHVQAGAAQAFFAERFGRQGFDGRHGALSVVAHPAGDAAFESSPEHRVFSGQAYWDGARIILGDGTATLETVTHEFAHAVAGSSARFLPGGESGALEEAFAAMMASAAGFDAQARGDCAECAVRLATTIRQTGSTTDATASSVARIYELAVDGGVHPATGTVVEGVGAARRADVERALYRAFVYLMPSSATLASARAATLQSSRDLLGDASAVERALDRAWAAAGVR